MALYIGNNKIASLSQKIDPDKVGDGLSVDNNGRLQIDPGQLAEVLGEAI